MLCLIHQVFCKLAPRCLVQNCACPGGLPYLRELLLLLQLLQLLLPLLQLRLTLCQHMAGVALPGGLAAQHRCLQLQLYTKPTVKSSTGDCTAQQLIFSTSSNDRASTHQAALCNMQQPAAVLWPCAQSLGQVVLMCRDAVHWKQYFKLCWYLLWLWPPLQPGTCCLCMSTYLQ
jgi:hypothetical protein